MENKNFEITFKSKEEMVEYGKEKLYTNLVDVINDIDENYIVKISGTSKEIYSLFNFNNSEDFEKQINDKSIKELKNHLKTFVENMYESLNVENSFIYSCFNDKYSSYGNEYKDLDLNFKHIVYNIVHENEKYNSDRLELVIMSYQKNTRCGNGRSLTFDLIDINTLNTTRDIINTMDIPDSVRKMYIDYLNENYERNISVIKKDIIMNIQDYIDDFLSSVNENYANGDSLFKQNFIEDLKDFIENQYFMKNIADAITVNYKEIDSIIYEDKVEIRFLNEIIKTISKTPCITYKIE